MRYLKLFIVASLSLLLQPIAHSATSTPNYWKCPNKVFGSWSLFGVYTEACDVDQFGDRDILKKTYSPLVITNKPGTAQVKAYMTEMYSVVRDVTAYYIKKRKPNVTNEELKAFQEAIFALAHQESFWSHYRDTTTSNLKIIRGDSGHGHGLMQVDDRHHTVGINKGVGVNLGTHFAYALDIYYEAWQNAPSKSCVGSANAWLKRTRAAYGAYNGGSGSYCRFTNPNHTWARNDKGFLDKFNKKQWLNFVSSTTKPAPINIGCLSEGQTSCTSAPAPTDPTTPPPVSQNTYVDTLFYKNSKGLVCAHNKGKLECLPEYRDAACLNAYLGRNIQQTVSLSSSLPKVGIEVLDRNQICRSIVGLIDIGAKLQLGKTINMRATAAGTLITSIPAQSVLQVVDYEVLNDGVQSRYYVVNYKNRKGYIFAGEKTTYAQWAIPSKAVPAVKILAEVGDQISIVASSGINQRKTIGGSVVQLIPPGAVLVVKKVVKQTANNDVYYQVDFKNKSGFIYSGQSFPKETYGNWTKVQSGPAVKSMALAQVKSDVYYKSLQECTSEGCVETDNFVPGPKLNVAADKRDLEVLEETNNGWAFVKYLNTGATGWIRLSDLEMMP